MSALLEIEIQIDANTKKRFTVSISDETNRYGQNVSVFNPQTEAARKSGEPKQFVGNGHVFWTDGSIKVVDRKADDLPEQKK